MSAFTSQIRHRPWLAQVSVLAVLMGGLLALALKTQDRVRTEQIPNVLPSRLARAYVELRDDNNALRRQVADYSKRLQKYQQEAGSESERSKLLAEDLRKAQVLAGMTPVTGPGVVVILRDSARGRTKPADLSEADWYQLRNEFIIHDRDIRDVVNELKASGAEAVAVNDQRVIANTPIRCVGPVVYVNNLPTSGSPVRIAAIGDADALLSGLLMAEGVLDGFKVVDPAMVKVDKVSSVLIPAFNGDTRLRYAKVASDAKAEEALRASENAAKTGDSVITGVSPAARGGQGQ
ncbi:MAG: DUF881 domain-containing protein [Armatimonadota bacterium]